MRTAAGTAGVLALVTGLVTLDTLPVGVFYDDAMYVVLARALATGHGYHWLHLPHTPAATHFPPGYPAVLALLWTMFPTFPANVLVFKAFNALLLGAVAVGIVVFACRRLRLTPLEALAVSLVGCLAIPTLVLSTQVMSEMLFLALLLPALLVAEWVADGSGGVRAAAGVGVLAGALMLIRSHGLAFAVAVAGALIIRRRWRSLGLFLPVTFAVALPWHLWTARHDGAVPLPMRGSYESYGRWWSGSAGGDGIILVVRTGQRTLTELFLTLMSMSTAGLPPIVRPTLTLLAVGLLALGLARLRRSSLVTALFVAAYGGVVVLWPFTPARFIWGVWPLVIVLAALGASSVRDWRPARIERRALRACAATAIGCIVVGYSVYTARGIRGAWWSSIPRSNAAAVRPLIQWAVRRTPPEFVIASNAEVLVYLYADRVSVPAASFSVHDFFAPPTQAARTDALRSILRAYHVDAVAIVANDPLSAAARAMAEQRPPDLVLRDSIPNGLIFSSTLR
jgi:hypothetical protein